MYAGAPDALLARAREDNDDDDVLEDRVGNAIEMAILSQAKRFIKSSPCQKVIDGIWRYVCREMEGLKTLTGAATSGKIVYQADSSRSILSDVGLVSASSRNDPDVRLQTYKRNPIHFYDPHKAPLLDHYRCVNSPNYASKHILTRFGSLKVPAIRSVLEYMK